MFRKDNSSPVLIISDGSVAKYWLKITDIIRNTKDTITVAIKNH